MSLVLPPRKSGVTKLDLLERSPAEGMLAAFDCIGTPAHSVGSSERKYTNVRAAGSAAF
jgi:hypothetical protein